MDKDNFQFTFKTTKSASEVFQYLIKPTNWWMGLFDESIEGDSIELNDQFSFKAGNGIHASTQKLIELETNKKIVWLVTQSNLSFLKHTDEWEGTTIRFYILQDGEMTKVTFLHEGLVPEIECYESCSTAWTKYLQALEVYFSS